MADLRSRQLHELKPFSEAVRNIAVSYDGLVVPGALLLLTSGTWTIVKFYGGWNFLQFPWLAGMVGLFVFEFIEGNTITRLYFVRLRRLTRSALDAGHVSPELQHARSELVPTFTHFLDLPMLFLIIALGTTQPTTWTLFLAALFASISLATLLVLVIPRLYPWGSEAPRSGLGQPEKGSRRAYVFRIASDTRTHSACVILHISWLHPAPPRTPHGLKFGSAFLFQDNSGVRTLSDTEWRVSMLMPNEGLAIWDQINGCGGREAFVR
jgi:hypothetical protein